MTTGVQFGMVAGPPVDSAEFWRRAERTAASSDPDIATAQVIGRMCGMVRDAAADPLFASYAGAALREWRGGPRWFAAGIDPFDGSVPCGRELGVAESAWWWAKSHLKFRHHSVMIWDRLRERDQWQLLISPDVLVRMRPMKGDCAVYSTLIAAMLNGWGVPWAFVTVAADPQQPAVFSHVYVRAVLPDGRRFSLDASHGKEPGWKVPAHDVYRLQVWDSAGRRVPDASLGEFAGLGYYAMGRRRRGLLGLGDVCDASSADYDYYSCLSSSGGSTSGLPPCSSLTLPVGFVGPVNCDATNGPPIYTSAATAPGTAPASTAGDFNLGSTISNLLSQWTAIGSKVIAPTVSYTRLPNGQIVYSAPAGSAASSSLPLSLGTTSGRTLLLFGGAALLVLLLVSKGGR